MRGSTRVGRRRVTIPARDLRALGLAGLTCAESVWAVARRSDVRIVVAPVVVVVAALAQEDKRLIEEIADLTFHTLVLLSARGLTPADVLAELEKRHK